MRKLGHIHAIWRYPVKSMAGEQISQARLNAAGLEHDRLFAFESASAPAGMLRVSGAERRALLTYQASLAADSTVEVLCPTGERLPVSSAALQQHLNHALSTRLTLTHEQSPQTDVRPLALISSATLAQLSAELAEPLDPRRFRANLICVFDDGAFAEDRLCGQTLYLGQTAAIALRERTPRCRFITYDPAAPLAADPHFSLMKHLDRQHQGRAGVYASVLVPGSIEEGDPIFLAD